MVSTVDVQCKQCGTDFRALKKEVNRGKGLFCSVSCANKFRSINRENKGGFSWKSYSNISLSDEYKKAQRTAHEVVSRLNIAGDPCEICGEKPTHAHHDD